MTLKSEKELNKLIFDRIFHLLDDPSQEVRLYFFENCMQKVYQCLENPFLKDLFSNKVS